MSHHWDLAGRLLVSVDGAEDPKIIQAVTREMSPFRASSPSRPSEFRMTVRAPSAELDASAELQNPARDGMVTATSGADLSVLVDGSACTLGDPLRDSPLTLSLDAGFPLRRIFGTVVRPAMQLGLPDRGAAAVHSAGVELRGKAVLVAGWSETGKTETALALMELGASFISDKWTVVGKDGEASAFPINVGVRRWVLPYLPRLNAYLPRAARLQLRVAGAAAAVTSPVRRRTGDGRLAGLAGSLAGRAVTLADRAALTPDEVREAYGQTDDPARRVPLGTLLMLTTVGGDEVTARPADPRWAAARLAVTAAYERKELFQVLLRRRYALPLADESPLETALSRDRRVLEPVLENCRVVELRSPFPVDPRRVADAASPWL